VCSCEGGAIRQNIAYTGFLVPRGNQQQDLNRKKNALGKHKRVGGGGGGGGESLNKRVPEVGTDLHVVVSNTSRAF